MTELFTTVLSDILILVATIGAGYLVVFLKKKLGIEKLRKIQAEYELIKEIVEIGVRYAEQRYNSGEKLDEAVEWISIRLAEKGIVVSADEVNGLIESTVRKFKDEFGEKWAGALREDQNDEI